MEHIKHDLRWFEAAKIANICEDYPWQKKHPVEKQLWKERIELSKLRADVLAFTDSLIELTRNQGAVFV